MKANKDIDKLFSEGVQKNYPYDENLWAKIETELPNNSGGQVEKSHWRKTFILLFTLSIILFLESDSIVSFNQYTPRQINEQTEMFRRSDSSPKLDLVTKEQNTPNATKFTHDKTQAKISEAIKSSQNNNKMPYTSLSKKVEKQTVENKVQSIQSNVTQLQSPTPIKANGTDDIKTDDINPGTNLKSREKTFNSVFAVEEVSYPTINELSRLSSLGFQTESNYPNPMPQTVDKNKLLELQQKLKKRNYFIEFEVGRSFLINKQLSGLETSHSKYRNESENSRFQQSVGVNVLTNVRRFTVGVGVYQSNFYEQLSYSYNEEVSNIDITYDTSYTLINGNFNSNGTPVILIRKDINENRTEVTESINRKLVLNNQFKRISLPVSVGYTKTFGRFSAGLRTAVVVNYLYASSGGYVINKKDNFYRFDKKQQLQDWVIGNRNQLRLGYSLNEFVAIGTSLNQEHDLSSFTQNYTSKFNTYGLGIWLLYRPR